MVSDLNFIAKGLKKHKFMIGAVNVTKDNNKKIAEKFGISTIPSMFMLNTNGSLESVNFKKGNIEEVLNKICDFTNNKTCYNKDTLNN